MEIKKRNRPKNANPAVCGVVIPEIQSDKFAVLLSGHPLFGECYYYDVYWKNPFIAFPRQASLGFTPKYHAIVAAKS